MAIALVQWTPWVEKAVGIMLLSIGFTGEAMYAERRDVESPLEDHRTNASQWGVDSLVHF
jgi:hypothetical protein